MARYTNGQKTLAWAREQGWKPWKVENHNMYAGKKYDLYHIIDYLAIDDKQTIGIQACGADFNPHVLKLMIDERQNTLDWLAEPSRKLVIIGWSKVLMKRGGTKKIYKSRIAWIERNGKKLELIEK